MAEDKVIKCNMLPRRKIVSIKKLKVDEVPEVEPPRPLTASEKGFQLEDLVYKESLSLPGLTHSFRENDIKKFFNDTSLNGIDHWIQVGRTHIFVQDKWKISLNQKEVAQYLNCVSRIQSLLEEEGVIKVHLLWVSKCAPTSNSLKMLIERKVHIIIQDSSTEDLAKLCIKKIVDLL
jgi:hypothetical protein